MCSSDTTNQAIRDTIIIFIIEIQKQFEAHYILLIKHSQNFDEFVQVVS